MNFKYLKLLGLLTILMFINWSINAMNLDSGASSDTRPRVSIHRALRVRSSSKQGLEAAGYDGGDDVPFPQKQAALAVYMYTSDGRLKESELRKRYNAPKQVPTLIDASQCCLKTIGCGCLVAMSFLVWANQKYKRD